MNQINYQSLLENEIIKIKEQEKVPRLLLHACCAPCSSYVLEYLSEYFEIDVFFYNPNIASDEEYNHRAEELKRFVKEKEFKHNVSVTIEEYNPLDFYEIIKGYEDCKEGGERCFRCYELRMEYAAQIAKKKGYDYFVTTLSISPLKNAQKLNEIGEKLEKKYGVSYLYSDFKKKNGFKRSIELSKAFDLYRQNFCGCVFSKKDVDSK